MSYSGNPRKVLIFAVLVFIPVALLFRASGAFWGAYRIPFRRPAHSSHLDDGALRTLRTIPVVPPYDLQKVT